MINTSFVHVLMKCQWINTYTHNSEKFQKVKTFLVGLQSTGMLSWLVTDNIYKTAFMVFLKRLPSSNKLLVKGFLKRLDQELSQR